MTSTTKGTKAKEDKRLYDGKQVVRVVTQYKKVDLYNIGVEMNDRKGTGNYDIERREFNYEYVSLTQNNLYQEVKANLKKRKIEYLDRPNTNLLNGVTFTSGPEFFQSLGMKFKDSGRTYHTGDKKGQAVMIPDIKSKEDIPNAVTYFFDSCMEFLKDYVDEENILLAQIYYDEDTPHLQAYFIPVVNKVKRKCFVKDKNGNVVKEETKNKKGINTITPKLLSDDKGKIVYEEVDFLNYDQFWKDRGGKISSAPNLQIKCMYETLYYCGLRRGEARGLQWKDVNWSDKRLSVTKQAVTHGSENSTYYELTKPKTQKSNRILPIAEILFRDLKQLYEEQKQFTEFNEEWFIFGNFIPITFYQMRHKNVEIARDANIKKIRLHDFRHSCASLLINNNANIAVVSQFLGHASIEETLDTYTHLFKDKLYDAVNTINKLTYPAPSI